MSPRDVMQFQIRPQPEPDHGDRLPEMDAAERLRFQEWLRTTVAETRAKMKADPARGIPIEDILRQRGIGRS